MKPKDEEAPEVAKARKAKAAMKNAQANIAEVIEGSDRMARQMQYTAGELEKLAKSVGDILVEGYFSPDPGNARPRSVKSILLHHAGSLRERAL